MANPTTAKPAVAEQLVGDPLTVAMRASVPIIETSTGVIRELVGNVLSRVAPSVTSMQPVFGGSPTINPTGGLLSGPCLSFNWGRECLQFVNRGYGNGSSGTTTRPVPYSLLAVFTPSFTPTGTLDGARSCWVVTSSADGGAGGMGFTIAATLGTITLVARRNQANVSSTIALTKNHTYGVAVIFDDSGASKLVTFMVYDFTTQTLVTAAGGTIINLGAVANAATTATANMQIGGFLASDSVSFLGTIEDAKIYGAAIDDTKFAAYFADPWASDRGTYTSSAGTLTIGDGCSVGADNTTAWVAVTRATLGTTPYTYQWYASTTPGFTPGVGNIIVGATSARLAHVPGYTVKPLWYKCIITDAAGLPATVTCPQFAVGLMPHADEKILQIGDSIHQVSGPLNGGTSFCAALWAMGYRPLVHQRAVTGSTTSNSSGTGWGPVQDKLSSAVTDAIADGITKATIMLGANDASGLNAAGYQANMVLIINYLVLNGFTKIVIHYPTPANNPLLADDTNNLNLIGYQTSIDNLVVLYPGVVYRGDILMSSITQYESWIFTSFYHPLTDMVTRMGIAWAVGYINALYPSTNSGSGGGGGVIGTDKALQHGGYWYGPKHGRF